MFLALKWIWVALCQMGKKINIAIDGYSSSGKSSLAKSISKKFKMKYIDTGAMYRSITYLLLKNSIDSSNFEESEKKIEQIINDCNIEYNYNNKKNISETILNGARCDKHIRKNYVSEFVSIVSKSKKVRDFMIVKQKEIASNKDNVQKQTLESQDFYILVKNKIEKTGAILKKSNQ